MSADFSSVLAEMQADFLDGLPERCQQIEAQVFALERGDPGAFDELSRLVHSLKGSGAMFGIPLIGSICHQLENLVGGHHDCLRGQVVNTVLAYLDLVRRSGVIAARGGDGLADIERELDAMRRRSLHGRVAVLLAEPSEVLRSLYRQIFDEAQTQAVVVDNGLAALERLLHEPFDLFVASRELPGLNALAVLAAVREAGQHNAGIEAVIVTSNPAPFPEHLRAVARLPRDPQLAAALQARVDALAARRRESP